MPSCHSFAKDTSLSVTVLVCTIILVISGCNGWRSGSREHTEYFDRVFQIADSLGSDEKRSHLAFRFLDSAYNHFPEPGSLDLYRKYEWKRYYLFFRKESPQASYEYTDSILSVLRPLISEKKYFTLYGKTLMSRGDALTRMGLYDEAIRNYYEGRSILGPVRGACLENIYYSMLAHIYYKQEKYPDAIAYWKRELSNNKEECDKDLIFDWFFQKQNILDNIAIGYERYGLPDSAMQYYNQALRYVIEHEGKFPEYQDKLERAKGIILGNKAGIHYLQGDLATAEILWQKSIRINTQPNYDYRDAQTAMLKLANMYIETKDFRKARKILAETRTLLDTVPSESSELKWHKLREKYYASTGDMPRAYQALLRYQEVLDSLDDPDPNFRSLDIRKEFETLGHIHQAEMLEKESQVKSLYLIVIVMILFMSIVIIILVWINWRRSRRNIAELTALNHMIHSQNLQLDENSRKISRIMKMVAHDLRNPISGIMSATSVMAFDKDRSEDDRELLEIVEMSSRHSIKLIDEIMDADFYQNLQGMEKEDTDLPAFLRQCVHLLHFIAHEKGQEIHLETQNHVIARINRDKMWRVINNLVDNAIKFSPRNTTIHLGITQQEDIVVITVQDQGIGIPPELGDEIFEMFTRAKRPGTSGEKPFGLGLSISRQIVEAHGGKIWFESQPGNGTTFYIELPAVTSLWE